MTFDPNNPPSAAEFLDPQRWPPEPDEEYEVGDTVNVGGIDFTKIAEPTVSFNGQPLEGPPWHVNQVWQLPPDPLERIAVAIEALASGYSPRSITVHEAQSAVDTAAEVTRLTEQYASDGEAPHTWARKASESEGRIQAFTEELADLEAKYGTLLQVIADVEEALGKSKAAPALAAKAVIEAWKNPTIPEPSIESMDNHANHLPSGVECTDTCPRTEAEEQAETAGAAMQEVEPVAAEPETERVIVEAVSSQPGHARVEHDEQPGYFYCRDCTLEYQAWITWPCPTVVGVLGDQAPDAIFVPDSTQEFRDAQGIEGGATDPEVDSPSDALNQTEQPEHNAPVEEWREYARAQGLAGPNIDRANRSQIRTALGIAQPAKDS